MRGPAQLGHRPSRRSVLAALLLIAALAIRVAEVQRTGYVPVNDARFYLAHASDVARTGDYIDTGHASGGSHGATAYFPPGFPYFLAAVDLLDGHVNDGPAAVHPARTSQAVLGTAVVALTGLVAQEAVGESIALIALAIAAFYPVLIELSAVLVAENLLVALELAAVWAMLRAGRSNTPYRWIAGAGVLAGAATLAHQNAVVLLIPLAIAAWRRRGGAASLIVVGAAILTIAPWTIRNAIVMHSFIPVSDEAGVTLAGTYNPVSAGDPRIPYGWRLHIAEAHTSRFTEPALANRILGKAIAYVGGHPLSPFKAAFHNTLRLLELEGSYAWQRSFGSIDIGRSPARIGVLSFWVLGSLALGGAFTRAARAAPRWLWLVPFLFALTVVFVNAQTPRFREPLEPFVILLAGCALQALAHWIRGRYAVRQSVVKLGRPWRLEALSLSKWSSA